MTKRKKVLRKRQLVTAASVAGLTMSAIAPTAVVSASHLELDLDDLDLAHNTAQYLFE